MEQDSSSPTEAPLKRKRVVLTLKEKMEICERLENGESRAVLMDEFNIGSSTIYGIKAQAQKIKEFYFKSESERSVEKRHTLHAPKMEALDQALYEWFSLKRAEGSRVSGPMLQEKAREFHEKMNLDGQCSFSSGWLTRFKVRHGICKLDLSGEPRAAGFEAAASFRDVFSELAVDEAIRVTHRLNTEDVMEAVVNRGTMTVVKEEESDGGNNDDGNEVEKVSWHKAAAAFETVIAFAEQQPFFAPHHVMQLHIMQNLTLQEWHKAVTQTDLPLFFKRDTREFSRTASSTDLDPKPSTSTFPNPFPPAAAADVNDPNAKSTQ